MRSVYHWAERPESPLRDPVFVDDNGDKSFLKAVNDAFRSLKITPSSEPSDDGECEVPRIGDR